MGRICITLFVIGSAILTIFIFDPNTKTAFFTYVASHQSRLIAGLVVAFGIGMLWKGATATGAFAAIITSLIISYGFPPVYAKFLGPSETISAWLGPQLNFLHAVFLAAICAAIVHVLVSLMTQPDESKGQLTWHGLGLISKQQLRTIGMRILLSIIVFAVLGSLMARSTIQPGTAAFLGAGWTLGLIFYAVRQTPRKSDATGLDDRYLAGLLAACAVFVLFYFY